MWRTPVFSFIIYSMPKIIDTHSHVNFNAFKEDSAEVVKRALSEDIWMINVGTKYQTSRSAVEFAKNYLGYFSPKYLFLDGGTQYQFSVPNQGLEYLINLPSSVKTCVPFWKFFILKRVLSRISSNSNSVDGL